MTDLVSVQAIVYGYVQGVLFRDFISKRAKELGLVGYVRNLPEGNVEVNAEGRRKQLVKLIGYCKVGPPMAEVDKVVVNWSEYSGKFSHFSISY
ncbi:MAG TPA: acylphosphatase [Dehalococcoidia bacterium]|nr:acylphosphatase [Dehalococcoidia bacterium]